jgi:CBS domain-containing protein
VLVREIMTPYPAYIRMGADIRRAAEIISVSEVSHLMVLDHDDTFVGALSEDDLVRAMLPRFDDVMGGGGTMGDAFRIFLEKGREMAGRSIDTLVERDAITVASSEQVARAAVVMTEQRLRRLPVVDAGKLAGTLSRSDICRAVIYHS